MIYARSIRPRLENTESPFKFFLLFLSFHDEHVYSFNRCKLLLLYYRKAKNGVYYIKQGNQVVRRYCVMDSICGASGWNLITKLDDNKVKNIAYETCFIDVY